MAQLIAESPDSLLPAHTGPLGRLARQQYRALAAMRWRLLVNRLRLSQGVFELGARAVAYLVYAGMGLGLAVGAGAASYAMVSDRAWELLPIEFWVVCFLWQAVSVALASFQEQYDMGGLLRFPVNFGSFYALCVLFGLVDASTLLGSLCSLGILVGVTIARPGLFGWTLIALAVFAVFNILLVRAVLAWIDRWLAQRRSREIISAIFLVGVVSLQLLNPAVRESRRHDYAARDAEERQMLQRVRPWVKTVDAVQAWLPPGLAAAVIDDSGTANDLPAATAIGVLALYALGAGALLGVRLRAEYRGENLGEAPNKRKAPAREASWTLGGAGPISAVIEKDLRTLTRSTPQLFALLVPMIMVFVIGSLFRNGGAVTHHSFQFALPVCVAYGLLGFIQLVYNNLGPEGTGIQSLFLFPVPVRRVLLAKNLLHAALFVVVAALAGVLASLRIGTPSAVVVAITAAWIAFAVPANLAAGNAMSIMMPYRVNLGRIGRQAGSQANGLLSMLIQTTILGAGAAVIALCALYDRLWIAPIVLLMLAAAAVVAWLAILRNADAMVNERRDMLIAKLTRTE